MGKRFLAFLVAFASGLCWAITADLAVSNGGKVSFVANTARDSAEATCYYEIIRIWYN